MRLTFATAAVDDKHFDPGASSDAFGSMPIILAGRQGQATGIGGQAGHRD
jgi:hypothetical protein